MAPLAVFCAHLKDQELYEAVRLVASFTHTNELVIEICYIYCYTIVRILNGSTNPYREAMQEAVYRP